MSSAALPCFLSKMPYTNYRVPYLLPIWCRPPCATVYDVASNTSCTWGLLDTYLQYAPVSNSFYTRHYSSPNPSVPRESHFGILDICLVDGYLSHTPRMFPRQPCRTCTQQSSLFFSLKWCRLKILSLLVHQSQQIRIRVCLYGVITVPSTSAWWYHLILALLWPSGRYRGCKHRKH